MSIFYLIFVALAVYFSFRYDGIEEYDSHKQHRLWLMCIYMICLTGFSYGLGADKFVYMEEFETYPTNFSEIGNTIFINFMMRGQMPFWTLVNILSRSLANSFYLLQFFESIAINTTVFYLVSKYTHRYFTFILIYFFSLQYFIFNVEIMREGFSLSIILLGIHWWMNGKKWLFFVTIPIGLMFHVSAMIAVFFPFMKFPVTKRTIIIISLITFCTWLFSDFLLGKVILAALGGIGSLSEKIIFYSMKATTFFGFARTAITYLVIPVFVINTVIKNEPSEEKKKCYQHILSFTIFLGFLACSFAGLSRFFNYTRIFYLIFMSEFVYTLFRSKHHLILRAGAFATWLFLVFLQYRVHYQTTNTYFYEFYYPYTCILHEDKDVYFREIAHSEGVSITVSDKNVREVE